MYDYVFVTHLPSFYKVNLYNELAMKLKIIVVFIGNASNIRTQDFVQTEYKFDWIYLSESSFENRFVPLTLFRFTCFIFKTKYKKVVLGGWDLPEFWLARLMNSKNRNALALESSVNESAVQGLRGKLKNFFLSKISIVFASGEAHLKLLNALDFLGKTFTTWGVGLIHKPERKILIKAYEKKFLYLGRLSPEKNLSYLLSVFKDLPEFRLTLAGSGPLESVHKNEASSNIQFLGHVDNAQLANIFHQHDFLILSSLSEPWGLVVEESLYFGKPVIVSKRCGVAELVNSENGYTFDPESKESLTEVLLSIQEEKFHQMQQSIQKNGLGKKDEAQIQTYLDAITLV